MWVPLTRVIRRNGMNSLEGRAVSVKLPENSYSLEKAEEMGMGRRIALGCYAQSLRRRSKLHSYGSRKDSALYCTIYEI